MTKIEITSFLGGIIITILAVIILLSIILTVMKPPVTVSDNETNQTGTTPEVVNPIKNETDVGNAVADVGVEIQKITDILSDMDSKIA